ncbi:hypothetical protein BpHYR1_028893 [Brachionus plicatilis]|uniref:Uncharacterized protein n=1 Tax=Brachionus plicatilis TaxID=10195 RepID=A0A3M7RZR0_BRAPC|nr:hypothetical protein BpHYR1_028893 [Brachionus plicatilis]
MNISQSSAQRICIQIGRKTYKKQANDSEDSLGLFLDPGYLPLFLAVTCSKGREFSSDSLLISIPVNHRHPRRHFRMDWLLFLISIAKIEKIDDNSSVEIAIKKKL